MMVDERAGLLDRIRSAFASGDDERGYELIAEAIERLEMSSEVVANAMSDGLESCRPDLVGTH